MDRIQGRQCVKMRIQSGASTWFAIAALTTILSGCGGGSGKSDPTTGNVVGNGSANVGTGGGTVTTTDSRVAISIPPDALTTSTLITSTFSAAPAASAAIGDYLANLGPDGTRFNSPSKLTVQVDPTWLADDWSIDGLQIAFWSAGQWLPVSTTVSSSSTSLEAKIDHFSTWALVPRGGSDSSPDYTWERNSSGCLRTTSLQYNDLLSSLAVNLLGATPSNSLGCVTGVYLEDGYSLFLPSMRNHGGIDLKAVEGTPVYAPFDGKIIFQALNAFSNPAASTLTIESTDLSTTYRLILLHCKSHELVRGSQKLANPPAIGTIVLRGDRICLTGKVGANSPHLHVEVKKVGQDQNNFLAMSGSRGACRTSSFPDGWNRATQGYNKFTSPGCSLSDIRQNTVDPTLFLSNNLSVTVQPGPAEGKDIWTTSVFSYLTVGGGPGGGLDDDVLRVGGWGDEYRSLLQFNLSSQSLPQRPTTVLLRLFSYASQGDGTTSMTVHRITEFWDWRTRGTGSDRHRLWWADQPTATQLSSTSSRPSTLPAPTPGAFYDIDITDLYISWMSSPASNFGLELRPVQTSNRWSLFYSSAYVADPSKRPQLIITP